MRERAQRSPLIGSVVEERYRIEAELGAGAMGSVYRGRHIKVGRTVAIKVLHDHLVREPAMLERFEREARLAAKLQHPNLVAVIDLGATPDGKTLMVLEYAPGCPLAELVRAPLPRERVIELTRQLLRGLDHAHRLGLVHRDLKPENVLVERTREGADVARIVDFGIAVLREPDGSVEGQRLTTTGVVLGTPMYMSPEQARGEPVDPRTDLFALGVIVYEMVAGKPPFEGSGVEIMMQNITQDPPSVFARAGVDVEPQLEAFARRLMAREVEARFTSAAAALAELEQIEQACVRAANGRSSSRETVVTGPVVASAETRRSRCMKLAEQAPMLGELVEDRYLVEAELGAGAMGRVYRARHIKVGRQVALKVMHREHAQIPAIVERFAREAMIAARVRHPNLVSVLDVGSMPDKSPMIVLELAPGTKLASLIDGPLASDRVVALVRQLLRGLEHAHAAGLIHRDLKPDNILVETAPDGTEIPRIVDFGIAVTRDRDDSVAGRRLTEANTVIGTPFYMSPEQARGNELDHRSDLFSLGVIVYELLAGVLPFDGTTVDVVLAQAAMEPPMIAERAGVHVDPLLEAFARKLMARRPDDRFQSAHDALAMLELIERNRIAAARALSCVESSPAGADEPASTRARLARMHESDALPTQPLTTNTRVASPTRRRTSRARLALAVATLAALASGALTLAGAPRTDGSAATLDIRIIDEAELAVQRAQRQPALLARSEPERIESPAALRAPARRTAAPSTAMIVAPAHESVVVTPAHEALVEAPVRTSDAPVRDTSNALDSATVAARYIAVGKALRGAPDALWERYRRIRINAALATTDGRRAALDTLAEIERAIVVP